MNTILLEGIHEKWLPPSGAGSPPGRGRLWSVALGPGPRSGRRALGERSVPRVPSGSQRWRQGLSSAPDRQASGSHRSPVPGATKLGTAGVGDRGWGLKSGLRFTYLRL